MKKKRIIKAWTLVDENGELLGRGQRSFEYFYDEEAAKYSLKQYFAIPEDASPGWKIIKSIFVKWKVIPIEIHIPPPRSNLKKK